MKQFVLPPRKAGEKPLVSQAWRAGFQSYQKLKQVNKKLSFECVCVCVLFYSKCLYCKASTINQLAN